MRKLEYISQEISVDRRMHVNHVRSRDINSGDIRTNIIFQCTELMRSSRKER